MPPDTILSTSEVFSNLHNPDWVTVDCRFDLADPALGSSEYQRAHIPGSVYAHLDEDLSSLRTPLSGRHPLPFADGFIGTCSRWGISSHTQVVIYDSMGGAYAARLWWLLHDYGHTHAAVLDGGWQKWLSEGKPVRTGMENRPFARFTGTHGHMPVIFTSEVEKLVASGGSLILDARSPERYRGLVEPVDPVAGHIPGAINRFHGLNLAPEGTFLSPDRLRFEFSELEGAVPINQAVMYCGSGVTSCHNVLAMRIAGLPAARLYPGSWSEWILDPHRPVALDT